MRRTCNPEKPVRVWHGAPSFLRVSEPVSCWPHKPCEWRSTRQPATKFRTQSVTVAEWLRRQNVDLSTRVQFPPVTPVMWAWLSTAAHSRSLDIRGLGKRINPLGVGPRESRFKSEVPDQFLCQGSYLVDGASPTKRKSRVRFSALAPVFRTLFWAPVAEMDQALAF